MKKNINIMSDGDPGNKGEFSKWIENLGKPHIVKKITAKGFNYSNNMSESLHSTYKTEFMQKIVQ